VIKTYELVESSTRGERKEFAAMLAFAQAQNETVAIIADAVDRFQRSFKESVLIDELIRKEKVELRSAPSCRFKLGSHKRTRLGRAGRGGSGNATTRSGRQPAHGNAGGDEAQERLRFLSVLHTVERLDKKAIMRATAGMEAGSAPRSAVELRKRPPC
jgi:hypothetical protein